MGCVVLKFLSFFLRLRQARPKDYIFSVLLGRGMSTFNEKRIDKSKILSFFPECYSTRHAFLYENKYETS